MAKISFWKLLEDNKVVIPIIQRDYAQGRVGKEHIREKFLAQIKAALTGPDNSSGLDFVYGTTKDGVFYPLDGQQRLTTLWLLHWFVASKAGTLDEAKEILKRFSYETRTSSREFCEKLCEFDISKVSNVSDAIQKQTWFYAAWKQDPTIQSMLRMLEGTDIKNKKGDDFADGIEEVFQCYDGDHLECRLLQCQYIDYWEKLSGNDCPICFSKLEINSIELPVSDDLYIKMNARGKPLTDFENFKADLISSLEDQDAIEYGGFIDNAWTNHFWNKEEMDVFDAKWMAFLCRFAVCVQTENGKSKNEEAADVLKEWSVYKKDTDKLFSYEYKDFRDFKDIFTTDVLCRLNKVFKGWAKLKDFSLASSWGDDFCFIPKKKENEEDKVSTLTMKTRVLFYGTMLFCEKCGTGEDCCLEDKWNAWKRVMWNLAENTNESSTIEVFVGVMKMFKQLGEGCLDIYQYLDKQGDELEHNFEQLKEEIEKARYIIKNSKFENPIKEAESLSCLKGKINVLFQNGDDTSLGSFEERLALLNNIIDKSKTIPFYLQRVLLSKLDALPNCVIDLKDTDVNKKTLLTKTLANYFSKVTKEDIQCDIPPLNKQVWINDLTQTKLLEYSRGTMVSCYKNRVPVLWGTSGRMWKSFGNYVSGNVILGKHRDFLRSPDFITKAEFVAEMEFVCGNDVNFMYDGFWFQWYGAPGDGEFDIYLLKNDWERDSNPYEQHLEDPDKQGDERTYYCFKVDAAEKIDSFKNKLNDLIKRAGKQSPSSS